MKRLHVFFSGTVQGVGFRYTARRLAAKYSVTGFVKNLADGRVELVAEGAPKELEGFLAAICASDLGSYIQDTERQWEPPQSAFRTFDIAF